MIESRENEIMADIKKEKDKSEKEELTFLDLQKQVDEVQNTLFKAEEVYAQHEATCVDVQYIFDRGGLLARQGNINLKTTRTALDISKSVLNFVTDALKKDYKAAEEAKNDANRLYQEELAKKDKLQEKLTTEIRVIKNISDNLDKIMGNLIKIRIDFEEANEELINLSEGTARYKSVQKRMEQAQATYNQTLEIQNSLFQTLTLAVRTRQQDKAKFNSLNNSTNMAQAAAIAAKESFESLDLLQASANEIFQKSVGSFGKANKQVKSNQSANDQAGEALKNVKDVLVSDREVILEIKQHLTDLTVQMMKAQQEESLRESLLFAGVEDSDPSYGLLAKKSPLNQYREKLLLDDKTTFQEKEEELELRYEANSETYSKPSESSKNITKEVANDVSDDKEKATQSVKVDDVELKEDSEQVVKENIQTSENDIQISETDDTQIKDTDIQSKKRAKKDRKKAREKKKKDKENKK